MRRETYCQFQEEKRETAVLTDRRKENLKKAFSFVDFRFEHVKCSCYGLGDRPQFKIPGALKETGQSILYRTAHPGGGEPSLRIFVKNQRDLVFIGATQKRAKEIEEKIKQKITYKFSQNTI